MRHRPRSELRFLLFIGVLAVPGVAAAQQPPPPNPAYGGLAPPASGPPPSSGATPPQGPSQPPPTWQQPPRAQPPRTDTERALRDGEEKDSGRGLEWFALQPEVGLQQLGLTTLSGKDGGGFKTSGVAPLVGVLANVRLLFVTIGVRARVAFFSDFKYWNLGPELGFHMPIGNLEPYAFVGGGYAALGGLPDAAAGVSVHGFDIRLGVGLDYYVSRQFSIGGLFTSEIVPLSASFAGASSSSTGLGNALSLVLGVHL